MTDEHEGDEIDGGEIPSASLPPGFAASLDAPPGTPAIPRAAATTVLLRPSPRGTEVLLVRRTPRSGFVPGAWVFPGGRVDTQDADPRIIAGVRNLLPDEAAVRLGLPEGDPPAIAYYLASVRELFEETGLWPGVGEGPDPEVPRVARAREGLLSGSAAFADVLDELGLSVPGSLLTYIAHWITPVQEPRRYDTRFFATIVGEGARARIDAREMTDAAWLTPGEALSMHASGDLPMVFPTLHTLEALLGDEHPEGLLERFRGRSIPAILPRLVRTPGGVALKINR